MKGRTPKLRTVGLVVFAIILIILFGYMVAGSGFRSTYDPDIKRFSENSIDVAMANGTVKHETPTMYAAPSASKTELLFPPSAADLERLSGK
jgi:hypothetical protein